MGFALYAAAVSAARDPFLYVGLGVPDTLDGRFDLVGLFVVLLIERLRRAPLPGSDLAQAVFDAMFNDMDMTLREMGVGDLSVGKKVKVMWEALHGRAAAYAAAIDREDDPALAAALERNVWRGVTPPAGSAAALARLVFAERAYLADQSLEALAAGQAHFRSVTSATGGAGATR
ncbi:MAG: ubiquinol-cytochrome C chaperone [Pseudomonadota bacterium]|nr:ubiquinol-cytochrome C chaperone [Pseudomonadota bacterium]